MKSGGNIDHLQQNMKNALNHEGSKKTLTPDFVGDNAIQRCPSEKRVKSIVQHMEFRRTQLGKINNGG